MRLRPAVVALACFAACAPVSTGSNATAVRNTCIATPDCTVYKQTGAPLKCSDTGVCQSRDTLDVTLVITLPDGAAYAPGNTFVAKFSDLATARNCALGAVCRFLPSLGQFAGLYSSTNAIADQVGFSLGTDVRSVPTLPTFRRAWSFVDGAVPVDVDLIGMPLQPLVASTVLRDQPAFPAASVTDSAEARAPSVGFDIVLPAGQYEETLAPSSPFGVAFPPVIVHGAVPKPAPLAKRDGSDFQNAELGRDKSVRLTSYPVTVTRGGGLSLADWTLYLRDQRTLRPVSSQPRLTTADTVTLFTVDPIRGGVDLVLAPPAGVVPRPPEMVLQPVANRVAPVAPYPLLPFQAVVDGVVLADDGTAVQSEIHVESRDITTLSSEVGLNDLIYADQFSSAADGTFSRTLPPGKYTVVVTPAAATGFAKTVLDLTVAIPTSSGQHQLATTLRVLRPELLHGTVRTADGRNVGDAEVEARPSVLLPYALDVAARAPSRWPRTVRTRTTGAGEFVLPVDPGSSFDLIVRPAPGTGFPWVVLQQVTAPSAELVIEVPAPVLVGAFLRDPNGQPASQALVQAYMGVASTTPGQLCTSDNDAQHLDRVGSCPATTPRCAAGHCVPVLAVEIGRTRTDDFGRFTLFLDGRPR